MLTYTNYHKRGQSGQKYRGTINSWEDPVSATYSIVLLKKFNASQSFQSFKEWQDHTIPNNKTDSMWSPPPPSIQTQSEGLLTSSRKQTL